MAIIKQYNKRYGTTYVYESHSYWDKEKRMTRAKRKLIGRLDPDTGDIVPTKGRNKKNKDETIDYKKLCERLQKKLDSQQELVLALQKELKKFKG